LRDLADTPDRATGAPRHWPGLADPRSRPRWRAGNTFRPDHLDRRPGGPAPIGTHATRDRVVSFHRLRVFCARESRGSMHHADQKIGWSTLIGMGIVVAAFMLLSLVVTATGTARFAVSMGYDAKVGYAVGGIFDLAKGLLPVGVLALLARRALGSA